MKRCPPARSNDAPSPAFAGPEPSGFVPSGGKKYRVKPALTRLPAGRFRSQSIDFIHISDWHAPCNRKRKAWQAFAFLDLKWITLFS
jgi:hypothetical protein